MNLLQLLKSAAERSKGWADHRELLVEQILVSRPSWSLDWDVEGGEKWLRFLSQKNVMLILRSDIALGIISSEEGLSMLDALSNFNVEWVKVSSWEADELSLDVDQAREELPGWNWDSLADIAQGRPFSASDLWYCSVT